MIEITNKNKFDDLMLKDLPLTMAFVPYQKCIESYDEDQALNKGTLYPNLDKPFYGVYCGQSALPLEGENLQYFSGGYIDSLKVYDFEHSKDIPVYDMEKANGKDPYEMYLSGSISLLSIDNPKATADKELIVFRDSFGSSIAPLLASGYSKVTLVDIRYISSFVLGNFVNFKNADVLFLYSTLVLNNSEQFR